jgi:subtilisin family serine protease
MRRRHLTIVAMAFGLGACAPDDTLPPAQVVRVAPEAENEMGQLVWGVEKSEVRKFLEANRDVSVREIYPPQGLYELQNASAQGQPDRQFVERVRVSFPRAQIAPNYYFVPDPLPAASEYQRDDCFSYPEGRDNSLTTEFKSDQPVSRWRSGQQIQMGEAISYDILAPSSSWTYNWRIDPPRNTGMNPEYLVGPSIRFRPKTSGFYKVSVRAKTPGARCYIFRKHLLVEENPDFRPVGYRPGPSLINPGFRSLFWHLHRLGAPSAWALTKGRGVRVAVLDSGINYLHPALAPNLSLGAGAGGYDFENLDPLPFDINGHGSHVSGLVSATTMGVAPEATLIPIKVLGGIGADMGTILGGLLYAADQRSDIINASFTLPIDHPMIRTAIAQATIRGSVFVAAAGNGDQNGSVDNDRYPTLPSSYKIPGVIAVGAIDESEQLTGYSNFGRHSVHLAAFGGTSTQPLVSTFRRSVDGVNTYLGLSGTSMATPLVSGGLALALSLHPDLKPAQALEKFLQLGLQATPTLEKITVTGGRLNLGRLSLQHSNQTKVAP